MELTHRTLSVRRTAALVAATAAAALAIPAAANAAVDGRCRPAAPRTLDGDAANDTIAIAVKDGGLLTHNLTTGAGTFDERDRLRLRRAGRCRR